MDPRFDEVVTTRLRLREFYKETSSVAANKEIDHIDDVCRRFIAASPFVMISTRGQDGRQDISPKGDPTGFVAVLDDSTLAIPDRLGNNRLDTFENVLSDPDVGLFFMIPGHRDTLRVSGKGQIVRDRALQERLSVNNKSPNLVLVVTVEQAFLHCSKCIIRSRLWQPERWPDLANVPSMSEALVAHGATTESVEAMQDLIVNEEENRLY